MSLPMLSRFLKILPLLVCLTNCDPDFENLEASFKNMDDHSWPEAELMNSEGTLKKYCESYLAARKLPNEVVNAKTDTVTVMLSVIEGAPSYAEAVGIACYFIDSDKEKEHRSVILRSPRVDKYLGPCVFITLEMEFFYIADEICGIESGSSSKQNRQTSSQ